MNIPTVFESKNYKFPAHISHPFGHPLVIHKAQRDIDSLDVTQKAGCLVPGVSLFGQFSIVPAETAFPAIGRRQ